MPGRRTAAAVGMVATVAQEGVGGLPRSGMNDALSPGHRVRSPRVTGGHRFQVAAGWQQGSAAFDASGALTVLCLLARA